MMSAGFYHGLWTLMLLVTFCGIAFWAFSPSRKQQFEEAARLALTDDEPTPSSPRQSTQTKKATTNQATGNTR